MEEFYTDDKAGISLVVSNLQHVASNEQCRASRWRFGKVGTRANSPSLLRAFHPCPF